MEIRRRSVLMLSAPALGAFLLSAVLLGGIVSNATDKFSEGLGATGYVVVSVVRDGNEIYHYEDHNQITEGGIDFFVQQVSGSATTSESAEWIALTTADIAASKDDDDATLTSEITASDLKRAQGSLTYTPGTDNQVDSFTISNQFDATGAHTGVQGAGLFTANVTGTVGQGGDDGTMVALNDFSDVNLANGDQLTITWTIDLGLTEAGALD